MIGEVSASALAPGLQGGEEARRVVQEGVDLRQPGVHRVQRRRAFFDRFFDVGARRRGRRRRRSGRGRRTCSPAAGRPGRRSPRAPRARVKKPAKLVRRRGQVGGRRLALFDQAAERPDRFVQLRAAAGERVAEARQVALDRFPRRLVEHVEEFVDVPRFGRRVADRDRFAGLEADGRAARRDLQVLEPERRFRPHLDRRVVGDRFGALVEAQRHFRLDFAVLQLHRDHRLDHADPGAADPHLVRLHQRVGVRRPAPSGCRWRRRAGRCWRCRRGRRRR